LSQIYKRMLRLFFGGRSHDYLRNGIMLRLGPATPKFFFGRLVVLSRINEVARSLLFSREPLA